MELLDHVAAFVVITMLYSLSDYIHRNGYVHVEIDKGVLRGCNSTTWNGEIDYFSFRGIPYAKPPVGEFRFKAPREEAAWVGVRDAVRHGEVCPQVDMAFRVLRGNEDCLFLNVYTPSLDGPLRPVMFWIHGGMFMLGSGNDELWGPDYLINDGIVLVTVNYRLGALGFLSTEDDDAPGNAGMKDQVAALKWVKRNIAKFGGDPDNVTIFGGSTGGACVHFHLLSPMSSGLFHKAISQSGTATNTWALSENGPELTLRLAEGLGAEDVAGNKSKAFEFLRTASPEDLVRAQQSIMTAEEERIMTLFLFRPSIEKNVKSEEVFLSDSPLNIMKSGNFNNVPYITGYNDNEGHFFTPEVKRPETMRAAIEDTERFVPRDFKNQELRKQLAKSIRKFYFHDEPVGMNNVSNLMDLYTDAIFVAAMARGLKFHLKSTNLPTYFYVMSHGGKMNLLKYFLDINPSGAIHGDELGYLFHHRLLFWKNPIAGSADERVTDTMIRLWTNFAKYGDPTPPGDPLTWKPMTIDEFNYLNISGLGSEPGVDPDLERNKFWAEAYERDEALGNELEYSEY